MVGPDGLRQRNRFGCTVEASQEFSATIQRLEVVAVDAVASSRRVCGWDEFPERGGSDAGRPSRFWTLTSTLATSRSAGPGVLSSDGGPPWLAQGV